MSIRSLERLLAPRSIAVIGGQEARLVIEECDRIGFDGEIWPVHPKADTVQGRRCWRDIESLPGTPDAAFIGVNRTNSIAIVEALARRGAGGAICYASGFREGPAESRSVALEERLLSAAGSMPLIGPNCYGLINALDAVALWPGAQGLRRESRGVAIVTQSSNVAINITMQMRGLPIAYMLTAGNQAQLSVSALAGAAIEDPRVSALGLHIEGINDVVALETLAQRARDLGKPVVALKVGQSDAARDAAISHTASLAGDSTVASALFARLGIGRANSLTAFVETLKLLHVHGALDGFEIGSLSCSGGEAALIADAASGRRARFAPLPPGQARSLKATLGEKVTISNPLDYHTFIWGDRERMRQTYAAMLGSGFALTLLVLDIPRSDRCDSADWLQGIDAFKSAARSTGAAAAIVASLPDNLPETLAQDLIRAGIVPLCGFDDTLEAIDIAATIGAAWRQAPPPPLLRAAPSPDPSIALAEDQAKAMLAAHGIAIPEGEVVTSAEAACDAAGRLGYPVAVKALGLAHKTEHAAVRLGLRDKNTIADALGALAEPGRRFLIERMAPEPVAELILGVTRDPVAGHVMTVGAGGQLVELIQDTATLLLPLDRDSAARALRSLTLWPLLDGYRGRPKADIEAVIAAMLAIGRCIEALGDRVEELEVNPIFVMPGSGGAVAVDALVRLRGGFNEWMI